MDASDISAKIVDEIKLLLSLDGSVPSDVRPVDFVFGVNPPSPGICVSPIGEVEDESTNETSDIGYQFSVVRVIHNQTATGGLASRAGWRKKIFDRFNRVRLGLTGELVTRIKHADFQSPKEWKSATLDSSGLIITVWIRQKNNG